jgi:hypothetical protein
VTNLFVASVYTFHVSHAVFLPLLEKLKVAVKAWSMGSAKHFTWPIAVQILCAGISLLCLPVPKATHNQVKDCERVHSQDNNITVHSVDNDGVVLLGCICNMEHHAGICFLV